MRVWPTAKPPIHRPRNDLSVLIISNSVPVAEIAAGERRLIKMAGLLAEKCHVDLVSYAPDTSRESPSRAAIPVRGFVPDLQDVYGHAALVVAPLRYGAGVKGKVCEALAMGLPVVTTRMGLEGLSLDPERHLFVTDDAATFSDAVVRVHENPALADQLASAGWTRVLDICGEERAREVLLDVITRVETKRSRSCMGSVGTRSLRRLTNGLVGVLPMLRSGRSFFTGAIRRPSRQLRSVGTFCGNTDRNLIRTMSSSGQLVVVMPGEDRPDSGPARADS